MARPSTVARRYAEAAFETAVRDGTVDAWRHDLDAAATALADPAVAAAVENPSIAPLVREEAIRGGLS